MNHQPYENWIFAESYLSGEQLRQLETHLNECSECQRLRQGLKSTGALLQAAPMAAPLTGFAQRWQASLIERRAIQQRRQSRMLFLALAGAALLILLLLALYFLATSTPVDWVVAVFQSTFSLFSTWNMIQDFILELLNFIPPVVPIAFWVLLTIGLSALTLVWIISLWRIYAQGATKYES